ncbi:methyltransferase domain-containing protein [Gammaproteobacteria bacterium]|nr:methyltransferase domain-containing protein [Gammaproteobacteria bacterium]
MNTEQQIEKKAKQLWGSDLHRNASVAAHSIQFISIFKDKWTNSLTGNLLEIGCGSGSDLEIFSKLTNLKSITAIDLGGNVKKLAEKYKEREDITVKQGNALSLNFVDEKFDVVYSFGIFHHTVDPVQCITEAKRVLKREGSIFLYLYSSHEDLLFKRIGISLEKIIMRFFKHIPYSIQHFICIALSPICWSIFSVPANILRFIGFNASSKMLPFYFGTHPFSLIGDLKDRLMSPINHRFSKLQMEAILAEIGFEFSKVIKTSSGLYIHAIK